MKPDESQQRRTQSVLALLPAISLLVSLACNLQNQPATEPPTPIGIDQTETADMMPSETTIPVVPSNTPAAADETLEPTLPPSPTATLEAFPTVPPGVLKEQLYHAGMGGGGDEEMCREQLPPPGSTLPVIAPEGRSDMYGTMKSNVFCIYGFPLDEDTYLMVYAPDGSLMGEGIMRLDSGDIESGAQLWNENTDSWEWIGAAEIIEGIPTIKLFLWMPIGLPYGSWKIAFFTDSSSFEGSFENTPPEGFAISTLPDGQLDLLPAVPCRIYGLDEIVYIHGYGFNANSDLPLGIYIDSDFAELVLVDSLMVLTGENGEFTAWLKVKDAYPVGYYTVIPNEAVDNDVILYANATGCFQVVGTSGVLEPAVPSEGPWEACPNTYLSRLRRGDYAMVSEEPPLPNRVRLTPNVQGEVLGQIPPGEGLFILDGPECANNWVWWYVRPVNQPLEGWTAEGDEVDYWLVPID